jgi:hypothetical protein
VPKALFESGQTGDPTFGRNQIDVLNYSTALNFTYTTTVHTPSACTDGAALCELQFDGVDTAAEVRWNGRVIGITENMHRMYRFAVHGAGGPLQLEVEIEPATVYAARVAMAQGDPGCVKHNRGVGPGSWPGKWGHDTVCSTYIRKNTGSFGWDCAPAYVSAGIWKSVTLRVTPVGSASIDSVVPVIVSAAPPGAPISDTNNSFAVAVRVVYTTAGPFRGRVAIAGSWAGGEGSADALLNVPTRGTYNITVHVSATNVPLWWPNGANPAGVKSPVALHSLSVVLQPTTTTGQPTDVADATNVTMGFRTFDFVGSVGNSTETFNQKAPLFFKVNGRAVYAKGFNWMPTYVLPADTVFDQADKLARLEDAQRVHANTIRVWGGGVYESDAFYAAADRLGLMVLQDGSFFGMSYPSFPDFFDNVREEMKSTMTRLARHPSLVVVSGNNEGSVFGNIPLYVDTELATVVVTNPNAVVYPSCPAYGWSTVTPALVPRPQPTKNKKTGRMSTGACREGDSVTDCPHDTHYYGPCGTIPNGTNMGTEFGWPSADLFNVLAKVTPAGEDMLRAATGSSSFLDYRSQIKNPAWTVESMLYSNSTLTALFPTLLTSEDNTREGMARWLYLTQVRDFMFRVKALTRFV